MQSVNPNAQTIVAYTFAWGDAAKDADTTNSRINQGADVISMHDGLLIREGRPLEIQQEAVRRVMEVLKDTFGAEFESGHLSLSVDIQEMREGIAQTLHNIPEKGKLP